MFAAVCVAVLAAGLFKAAPTDFIFYFFYIQDLVTIIILAVSHLGDAFSILFSHEITLISFPKIKVVGSLV